jgi:hypothetical protein
MSLRARPQRGVVSGLQAACVALCVLLLGAGYLLGGMVAWAPVALLPGVLWLAGRWYGARRPAARRWIAGAALALAFGVAAAGLWIGLGAVWMLAGAVAGLCAWDLDDFEGRLVAATRVADRVRLERKHLWHLAGTSVASLVLALGSLQIRLQLGFLPAILLGLLVLAGLNRTIRYLRHGGRSPGSPPGSTSQAGAPGRPGQATVIGESERVPGYGDAGYDAVVRDPYSLGREGN